MLVALSLAVIFGAQTPAPPPIDASQVAINERQIQLAEIDAHLEKLGAQATQSPEYKDVLTTLWVTFLTVGATYKPALKPDIDAIMALGQRYQAQQALADQGTGEELALIKRELETLSKKLAAESQDPVIVGAPEIAQLREKLAEAQWRAMQRLAPDLPTLQDRRRRLTIELNALQGTLRQAPMGKGSALQEARRGFATKVRTHPVDGAPPSPPPPGVVDLVSYPAPLGGNAAYVSPVVKGARRPAVVYIHGGFDWELFPIWEPQPRDNDQSGAAFLRPDMVVMLPSLRGTHTNPGAAECMFGEVDDLLAAGRFLKNRPDVDPDRIYLVGHSTGATLALLVAASQDQPFKAVFALGPISNPQSYGAICGVPHLPDDEARVRAPIEFLEHIKVPTWVIEGEDGNIESLLQMEQFAPPTMRFVQVSNASHFDIIRPVTELLAQQILSSSKANGAITLTAAGIERAMAPSSTPRPGQ